MLQSGKTRMLRREDATAPAHFFTIFHENFRQGYDCIKKAVDLEEQCKNGIPGDKTKQKVRAAELYKEGREYFKECYRINYMDIPDEKKNEFKQMKDRINNYDDSAKERIIAICDELSPDRPKPLYSEPASSKYLPSARTSARASSSNGSIPKSPACGRDHSRTQTSTSATSTSFERKRKPLEDSQKPSNRLDGYIESKHRSISEYSTSKPKSEASRGVNRKDLLRGVDSKFGERLLDEILDNTGVRLVDVSGCDTAKRALEEAVILPALNPSLFQGLRQPVKGILLFGPPGNGKTMLAKAVAHESEQVFLNISASSLTSKWVGESEKTIRALFQVAKNAQPSIIFIDEIDSLLTARKDNETEVSRRMKTEFMVQLDGASSSTEDRILIIGATNRPYELDDAILRRFPKRILIDLPDERARAELLHKTLAKHKMLDGLTDYDIRWIARSTDFYSNADLVALCKEAAMVPIRDMDRNKIAKTDGRKIRNLRVRDSKLYGDFIYPFISFNFKVSDFKEALSSVKPSCNPKLMEELISFADRAGQK
ncbi:hypothetical protein WR25_19444 isoform B [Diploscapter pachys]|uniref:microtubule-severing ATPase n=2 Tax=Diploscapter pachys TaxID=2018661 RepID=A0A2A2JWF0_9BILA|nr:hypothetical protein WR25_19444 isoform B [Diploscapter pachys]